MLEIPEPVVNKEFPNIITGKVMHNPLKQGHQLQCKVRTLNL